MISNEQKYECVQRELKMRQRVYPRMIDAGKITSEKAAFEIECMTAIMNDYEALAVKERLL